MERPQIREDVIETILKGKIKEIWKNYYKVEFDPKEKNITILLELVLLYSTLYEKKHINFSNSLIIKRNELELKYNFLYPKEFFIDFLEYGILMFEKYPEIVNLTYKGKYYKKDIWEDLIEKLKRFNFYKDYEVNVDFNFENPYENSDEFVLGQTDENN